LLFAEQGSTSNEPSQLALKSLAVPQVAVTLISLYVLGKGSLQFGALADQAILVGIPPLEQVTDGVIAIPASPYSGTLLQVSCSTIEELELEPSPLDESSTTTEELETPLDDEPPPALDKGGGGGSPPSSDEQERVNAKASETPAANSAVLISATVNSY
jgi:hypothetical protein